GEKESATVTTDAANAKSVEKESKTESKETKADATDKTKGK
ncbi:hypothetical protein PC110_g19807, partial [Phytophthora cactorum]